MRFFTTFRRSCYRDLVVPILAERRVARKAAWVAALFLSPAVFAQGTFFPRIPEPPREYLPPVMANPAKISPDRLANDEYPSITRDKQGRVWIAWSSCRTESPIWPDDSVKIKDWEWPDNGLDSIAVRFFDGKDWSREEMVSSQAGVNHKPVIVPDGEGIRVLWTSRREGSWAVYERSFDGSRWSDESRLPGAADALEVRATALADGSLLAVWRKLVPPRIELQAQSFRDGRWSEPRRLDEGVGRAHRPHLLAGGGAGAFIAWDEERDGNYDIWVSNVAGERERITESLLWDTSPSLAETRDGRLWLAWERREPIGGRFTYRGRSVFAKTRGKGSKRWDWAPSPFAKSADPGRLTRHSQFWAAHAMSEERYPQLLARANGDLWLLWLGGGRMSSVSFSGRVFHDGKWSDPRLIFRDDVPYTAFQLGSERPGVDNRASGRGPYQTPLANQVRLALDEKSGDLWMAYQVPRQRHITDRFWEGDTLQRAGGYGADIYSHRVNLDQRELRFAEAVDDPSAIAKLEPPPYRGHPERTLEADGKTYRLVWGDMHGHTENDGIGTFDMYYAHGLFVTGMDFVASSNHDYTPDYLMQSEWAEVQALSSVYNAVSQRVALSGWEWTTSSQDERGGHRAMYFMDDNGPLYRSTTVSSNTVWKLYALLRGQDVILQPHHNDWTGYDPELQPIFEITSAWRQAREEAKAFKKEGPVSSVWEALERGYRIGFVGSGDSHWMGTGEDFGITGAYVADLTREGIFEAIRAKRVFASSGTRMLLDVRVNGALMGEQITASGPIKIEVAINGDADLDRIEIVKDHKVIHSATAAGPTTKFSYVDMEGAPRDRAASYYYLRVSQKDQMYAWSSPTWVDWK